MNRKRQNNDVTKRIFVGNLLPHHSDVVLNDYFTYFGSVVDIDHKGQFAFVTFANSDAVDASLNYGRHTIGPNFIRVQPCRQKTTFKKAKQADEPDSTRPDTVDDLPKLLNRQPDVFHQMSVLHETTKLTDYDLTARMTLINNIRLTVDKQLIGSGCNVLAFGSTANGFGVQGCDLDLFLDVHTDEEINVNHVKRIRRILQNNATRLGLTQFYVIPSRRCPIVRFEYKPMGLQCDLSMKNSLAVRNTQLLRLFGLHHPCVKILVFAIRYWAKKRGIAGEPSVLSSYAITLLVIVYLQKAGILPTVEELSHVQEEDRIIINNLDVSFQELEPHANQTLDAEMCVTLLRGFFEYYSTLDLLTVAIVTRTARVIPKWQLPSDESESDLFPSTFKVGFLTVQDPFALDHNITFNINKTNAHLIRNEFQKAHIKIGSSAFNKQTEHSGEVNDGSLDDMNNVWGLNLLVSHDIPTDCEKLVRDLAPNLENTLVFESDLLVKAKGHVTLNERFDWLKRMADFVMSILTDVLKIESDVKVNGFPKEEMAEITWEEPIVENFAERLKNVENECSTSRKTIADGKHPKQSHKNLNSSFDNKQYKNDENKCSKSDKTEPDSKIINMKSGKIRFVHTTVECSVKYMLWERRNSIRQEYTVIQKREPNLELEKTITRAIMSTVEPLKNSINFSCDLEFINEPSVLELRLVFKHRKTNDYSFISLLTFLRKFMKNCVKNWFE